jgi:hypothetical protein
MSDTAGKTSTDSKNKDTSPKDTGTRDSSQERPAEVSAEPGSEQYTKTGDSAAVDTHGSPVGYAPYSPRSADEENLENPVSDEDPNFVEAARKLDPERVPESRGAADIEPKQE